MQVLEDVPDDLKGKDKTEGEASLKGHLKNGDDEGHGSQAYVPPDETKDKALHAAYDLLRGKTTLESLKQEMAKAEAALTPPKDASKTEAVKADAAKADATKADATTSPSKTEGPVVIPPVGAPAEPVLKQGPAAK